MALSVRPESAGVLMISHQRVPSTATPCRMARSSSSLHSVFFTSGHRWLFQRSRHCLPTRPVESCVAIIDQRHAPYLCTAATSAVSSSGVQGRLTSEPPHPAPAPPLPNASVELVVSGLDERVCVCSSSMLRSNAVMSSESTAISQSAERFSLVATNACGNGDAKRQNDRLS